MRFFCITPSELIFVDDIIIIIQIKIECKDDTTGNNTMFKVHL